MRVSIVTPWLDHPELCDGYAAAVAEADEVVVVDNGSSPETMRQLIRMMRKLGTSGVHTQLVPLHRNAFFARATNIGLEKATGGVLVALNNDVRAPAPDWLFQVKRDVSDGGLYGPSPGVRTVEGVTIPYIEGWCVAATRRSWDELEGFDDEYYSGLYWEDVDLSFRAFQKGYSLLATSWAIQHLSNTTSKGLPGAYDQVERNQRAFAARVRQAVERERAARLAVAQ